jgi:hypothetical protein
MTLSLSLFTCACPIFSLSLSLSQVQELREENLTREKELGDQIKRQQEQRFRNLQTSVASQVLEH